MVVIDFSIPFSSIKTAEVISQGIRLPLFFMAFTKAIDCPPSFLCLSIFLKLLSYIAQIAAPLLVNSSFLE